jgi:pilus assembly protein CpaC
MSATGKFRALACWTICIIPLAGQTTTVPAQTVPEQAAAAAATHGRDIKLTEGRGQLLQFQHDVTKVVVSEPKIADAVIVSPREIVVDAKAPGGTTVLVWESDSDPLSYEVTVAKDESEWENFLKTIQQAGENNVAATGSPEVIVLSGKVKSTEESKRLAGMAQSRTKNVVNLLQAPPAAELKQIMLQVKIADVDRTALTQIGFNLFSTNSKLQGVSGTEQFSPPKISPLQTSGGSTTSSSTSFSDLLNLFAFRPDLNLGATIKALQEHDLLQILAEPNLIALEGKDASFLAGGSFPYPTITTTPTGGAVAPVVTVQFKPFGVKLDFTPTVTAQGAIDLKVAPEVSSLDFSNAVTIDGVTIPALSQRRAETEVILKDGESFAIAGLINNQIVETMDKVPGLGDIPILGRLFRSRSTQKSDDELLVLITVHFVKPLSAEEKAKLPTMPETFLPAAQPPKAKGKKNDKTTQPQTNDPNQPQFVGPRGQEIPKVDK